MEVSFKHGSPAALSSGNDFFTGWLGGWMGPRVGVNSIFEKIRYLTLVGFEPLLV
jgi:hypothetical protein